MYYLYGTLVLCLFFTGCQCCDTTFYYMNSGPLSTVRYRGVEVHFTAPNNRTGRDHCVVTEDVLRKTCGAFNSLNISGSLFMYVTCDSPDYRLEVATSEETFHRCYGEHLQELTILNCSIGWEGIGRLAHFANPKAIGLNDVPIVPDKQQTTTGTAAAASRVRSILFRGPAVYPDNWSTADLLVTGLVDVQPFNSMCIRCQMQSPGHMDPGVYKHAIESYSPVRFPQVFKLAFSDTNLSAIPSFEHFGKLSVFLAVNCGMRRVPSFQVADSSLRWDEVFNQWETTRKSTYHQLWIRASVNAPDSPLLYKDSRVWNTPFVRTEEKYIIKELVLSYNDLKEVGYFEGIELLDVIQLPNNCLHGSRLFNISFAKNVSLLELSDNPLGYLPDYFFHGWNKLECLMLSNCSLGSIHVLTQQEMPSLMFIDLSINSLLSLPDFLLTMPNLISLNIEQNKIASVYFPLDAPPSQLLMLSLADTGLSTFPAELLTSSFPHMGEIVLWGNELGSHSVRPIVQLDRSLVRDGPRGVLQLFFNCIEYIPVTSRREVATLDRVLDSYTVYLHHNPLHCGCAEMLDWLQSKGVKNTFAIKCDPETMWLSGSKQEEALISFPLSRCAAISGGPYPYRCKADIRSTNAVKSTVFSLLGLVVLSVMLVFVRRHFFHIRWWVFRVTGLRLAFSRRSDNARYMYDAFLCYSGQDYRWIFQVLLPGLERDSDPPFSLCVHDRDFVPGLDIARNVMNAMEASRTAILLLSPHSSQSEWCGFEVNAAIEESVLRKRPFKVIPVILDHVNLRQFTKRQRQLLKTIPYLYAEDVNFLTKLKFILGDPMTTPS